MIPRPVIKDDLPEILHMIVGLAAHHDDIADVSLPQLERDLCGPHPWFTVLVAEGATGALLGYAALTPIGQLQFGARGMDMHHLFVRAQARGTGVGSGLLRACLATARQMGCDFMSVGTHPDNHGAAQFYEARGFLRRSDSGARFSVRLNGADQPPT